MGESSYQDHTYFRAVSYIWQAITATSTAKTYIKLENIMENEQLNLEIFFQSWKVWKLGVVHESVSKMC